MRRFLLSVGVLGGLGCAATTAPSPPPQQRLVVLNAGENTVTVVPVDTAKPSRVISFGPASAPATDLAARNDLAVVAGGRADELVVISLVAGQVFRRVALPAGSNPSAVAMVGDRTAYVANAGSNTVTRVELGTGDTASVAVGAYPRGLLLARGRLFVVNGNLGPCNRASGLCPLGPSWLTVVDPVANARAGGRDSIPLPSEGNAKSAALGGDGLVYVIHTGDVDSQTAGRLTIVDPVARTEIGNFGGFGLLPVAVASDGAERLFVGSLRDGLMEFNTRTRRLVRAAGEGIPIANAVAVAVDADGLIYTVESGGCQPGVAGRVRIFRSDLTEARGLLLGNCPVAATFVQLPGQSSQATSPE